MACLCACLCAAIIPIAACVLFAALQIPFTITKLGPGNVNVGEVFNFYLVAVFLDSVTSAKIIDDLPAQLMPGGSATWVAPGTTRSGGGWLDVSMCQTIVLRFEFKAPWCCMCCTGAYAHSSVLILQRCGRACVHFQHTSQHSWLCVRIC